MSRSTYGIEPRPKLGYCTLALHIGPFQDICLGGVIGIYLHVSHINIDLYWSMKKFHEVWDHEVTWNDKLYLCWIALLSEWNYRSSTKPCYFSQVTLIELYNKSHEGFVLSRDQENASVGLKLRFKLYCDATLTCVDQMLTVLAWSCILKKSWSLSGVEQNLFLNQEPDQLVSKSNRALKLESMPVLGAQNFA